MAAIAELKQSFAIGPRPNYDWVKVSICSPFEAAEYFDQQRQHGDAVFVEADEMHYFISHLSEKGWVETERHMKKKFFFIFADCGVYVTKQFLKKEAGMLQIAYGREAVSLSHEKDAVEAGYMLINKSQEKYWIQAG